MSHTSINDLSSISSSSSVQFAPEMSNSNNIDLKCLNTLNLEFNDLGYDPIYHLNKIDYNQLVKCSLDLVHRFRRQLTTIERVQEQNHVLDRENELFLKRQQNLKDSIENSSREIQFSQEKIRQSELKLADSAKNIKILTEENRKLQHSLEQRDKQFKNDKKKTEKEIEKLKLKIQSLTTIKTKELANIELSDPISKTGPRPTWNLDSNQSKKQLEMYSELIKDYDKKLKLTIIENSDLKAFISKVMIDLDDMLNQNSAKKDLEISEMTENKYQDLVQLPFDEIYKNLNQEFQTKLKQIDLMIKNHSENLSPRNDVTISSINSLSEALNKTLLHNSLDRTREKTAINLNTNFNHQKAMFKNGSISSSSLSSTTSIDSPKEK